VLTRALAAALGPHDVAVVEALLAPLGRDTEVAALPQGLRDVDDGQVSDSGRTVCIVDDL
jgi:hypothetical protein